MSDKLHVGIIGTGNIAGPYVTDLKTYPHLELAGVADIDPAKAAVFAAEHSLHAYPIVMDMLEDPAVDIVVNLTAHFAHHPVTTQALEHGKHVYSEKPLAVTTAQARGLVDLANEKGLRLACSPFTLAGEAAQTAWKLIRDGQCGKIRVAYAEVNWGRIESWHPAPGPFYEVGALFDVGVYPLTILTAIFGPAKRAQSYGKVLYPDRLTQEGEPFHIDTPDFAVTLLEMADGTVVRLTTNFYVGHHNKQTGIEFHGDKGSLYLSSWQNFDAQVEFADYDGEYMPVPFLRPPSEGTPWGRGVAELASAIQENRPHRFSGEHAAHVVEILNAATESMQDGRRVEITSTFTPPPPLKWAE